MISEPVRLLINTTSSSPALSSPKLPSSQIVRRSLRLFGNHNKRTIVINHRQTHISILSYVPENFTTVTMCVTSHYHDTCSKTYYYESPRARVSPTQPDCRCGKIVERRIVSFEHHCKYCKDYLRWGGCSWKRELKEETWKAMYADLEKKEEGEGEGAKMDWGEGKGEDERVWLDWSDEKKGRSVGRETTKGRSGGVGGRNGEGEDAKEEGDGFQAA